MDYQQLLMAYNKLLEENAILKTENQTLRNRFSVTIKANEPVQEQNEEMFRINQSSASEEKINLFMSLFRGREDVYAKRWYNSKTGKSGYQPVCGNEWSYKICNKQKYKCNVCPNRDLLSLNSETIYAHLSGKDPDGKDVIGIYPMHSDETCFFIAVDFDDEGYKEDASAFREACVEKGIPVSIERSRSGNGAHAWIFFNEPISAQIARKLGSGIITFAMNKRSEIKFNSYDRLFPNQDIMPAGGFGNLIALPLQGLARKKDNSVFVDEDFVPYLDQWAYLDGVQKLSLDQILEYGSDLWLIGDLGVLVQDTEEKDSKPWEKKRAIFTPSNFNFSAVTEIIYANKLYIRKEGISQSARNCMKRLASFKNPDFYKSQAMRLPTYDKPRIISLAEETEEYIILPRGIKIALLNMLEDANLEYNLIDKTNAGNQINVKFNGALNDEQQQAANVLLEYDTGILSATTAFGKTVIGANMIATRKVNTLILVHTQALLGQWKKSLEHFLDIDYILPEQFDKRGRKKPQSVIGELGAGKNRINCIVDVAVMQSLINGDEIKGLVRDYGMIIVDECHHVSAVSFEKILKYTTAKYIYGLTATPTRQDGHHPIIFMQCGDIRYRVDAKSQAQKRPFEHYMIPRFTSFTKANNDNGNNITLLYNAMIDDEFRNGVIISDVVNALENRRKPIILTERTEHVIVLKKMLAGKCDNIIFLMGSMSAKEKREAMDKLNELSIDSQFVIIATGKYVGEGFDFPRLDTLFLTMPIAWKGKVAQYAGRLHRLYEGKNEVLIYDYVDIRIPVLERMYHKRVKGYSAIGYKTKATEQDLYKISIIYDGHNFMPVYFEDIASASKNIVIVSPYMRKSRLFQIAKQLTKAILNGVRITVYTRPPDDFKDKDREFVEYNAEYLRNADINVIFKPNIHQKFTIIDESTVWYGSINFLSFGNSEESIMRLDSCEIADELLGIL